jgi:hypothetical protein
MLVIEEYQHMCEGFVSTEGREYLQGCMAHLDFIGFQDLQ